MEINLSDGMIKAILFYLKLSKLGLYDLPKNKSLALRQKLDEIIEMFEDMLRCNCCK